MLAEQQELEEGLGAYSPRSPQSCTRVSKCSPLLWQPYQTDTGGVTVQIRAYTVGCSLGQWIGSGIPVHSICFLVLCFGPVFGPQCSPVLQSWNSGKKARWGP